MEEKEALEFLSNQANTAADKKVYVTKDGEHFLIGDDVHPYHVDPSAEESIETHTLTSIIDYIRSGVDGRKKLFVHIKSPKEVALLGSLDKYGERETLIEAIISNDEFIFDTFLDREALNISLQSQFVHNEDQAAILKFIGNYKESTSNTASDDGITQTATVQTGAATVGKAKVPNPVNLKPYRTFPEVEQPESQFIFRMREGMRGALFEADGGAWKNEAIGNIENYFQSELEKLRALIHAKRMVVTILG